MITQLVSASVTPDQPLTTGGSLALGQKQPFGSACTCSISQTGAVKEHFYEDNCLFEEKIDVTSSRYK